MINIKIEKSIDLRSEIKKKPQTSTTSSAVNTPKVHNQLKVVTNANKEDNKSNVNNSKDNSSVKKGNIVINKEFLINKQNKETNKDEKASNRTNDSKLNVIKIKSKERLNSQNSPKNASEKISLISNELAFNTNNNENEKKNEMIKEIVIDNNLKCEGILEEKSQINSPTKSKNGKKKNDKSPLKKKFEYLEKK